MGLETLGARLSIPRHRHRHGYITVVLSGTYQEAGLSGRFELTAGCVAVHQAFDVHLDHVRVTEARLLNLPLSRATNLPNVFRIEDPDAIARLAERDPEAAALSLTPLHPVTAETDWVDELASAISHSPELRLSSWADANGLAPETLSRGFGKAFGVAPARFRIEMQAHRALLLIVDTDAPLARIAAECGFADQPHLTRSIVQITGHPPAYWRRQSIPFNTDRAYRR